MKKIILLLMLSIFFANAVELNSANSYKEAIDLAKKSNKKVLMFLYSKHCSWCDKMKNGTFRDKKVIEFINKKFIFLSVEKNRGNYPSKFNPRFIPSTYSLDPKTGDESYILYGFKSVKEFFNELSDE